MMRILVDTDVVLDVLLKREPFAVESAKVWLASEEGRVAGYVSVITPVNVYYISRKAKGNQIARQAVQKLLAAFRICGIDLAGLKAAADSTLQDYEDAVQLASAQQSNLDAILTRNTSDYMGSPLPVMNPSQFLAQPALSESKQDS